MERVSIFKMKISIVIPSLNPRIEDLREALRSCKAQTKPPFEIILADGGSSNIDQIEKETQSDPAIHLIRGTGGLTARLNRRAGVQASRGDYVIFLDCDDFLSPFFCQTVDHLCDKDQPDVMIFGNIPNRNWIKPDYAQYQLLNNQKDIQTYFLRFDQTYQKGEVRSVWAKAFKTSFLTMLKIGSRIRR